jgi:hypothetical protein
MDIVPLAGTLKSRAHRREIGGSGISRKLRMAFWELEIALAA